MTQKPTDSHAQGTTPATRRCICGLLENDPIHSYEWCFGGIEGAHELTLESPKSSYPVEQELREMCCRLRACVQKYGLGSGGEQLDELVIAEVDRCHALVDAPPKEPAATPRSEPRTVKLGVIEFHSERFNPGLIDRFFAVAKDLRDSASIVDVWLMDIATVLREFGYEMTITTTKESPRAK